MRPSCEAGRRPAGAPRGPAAARSRWRHGGSGSALLGAGQRHRRADRHDAARARPTGRRPVPAEMSFTPSSARRHRGGHPAARLARPGQPRRPGPPQDRPGRAGPGPDRGADRRPGTAIRSASDAVDDVTTGCCGSALRALGAGAARRACCWPRWSSATSGGSPVRRGSRWWSPPAAWACGRHVPPDSIQEPRYEGLLVNAPAVVGDARRIADRYGSTRDSCSRWSPTSAGSTRTISSAAGVRAGREHHPRPARLRHAPQPGRVGSDADRGGAVRHRRRRGHRRHQRLGQRAGGLLRRRRSRTLRRAVRLRPRQPRLGGDRGRGRPAAATRGCSTTRSPRSTA